MCDLLGFDLETLRAQAAEAIPYAKAWKDEVEDAWIARERGLEATSA